MIAHISYFDVVDIPGVTAKGRKVWFGLVLLLTRGNLVLGATEPRLQRELNCSKPTLLKALAALEAGDMLRWDRELAVIRLNPWRIWEGKSMSDEQWENASREWLGERRDELKHDRAQMDYIYERNKSA
jgi:hypothetical protein